MSDSVEHLDSLRKELDQTRARLLEAEETLDAIRSGAVDGLVMTGDNGGIFTLQGSQEPYRLLIEQMSEGAFTLSHEGYILYANECLAGMLQIPLERVIGTEIHSYVVTEDQPIFTRMMAEAWGGSSRGELAIRVADGTTLPLRLGMNRVNLDPGLILGVVATDLTEILRGKELERRVAERTAELYAANHKLMCEVEERRRAEEVNRRFAAIVNFTDDSIISKTLEGVITSWNPGSERMFGYRADEMIGQTMEKLIPPERAAEEHAILAQIGRGERVGHYETVRIRKDGRHVDVSITVSPVRDAGGKIIGVSKIARDITMRKQFEVALREGQEALQRAHEMLEHRVEERTAQLLAANEELEAFSYSVSHDLRSPLRAVNGFSQILLRDYGDRLDEEGKRKLGVLRSETLRMGRLIDDLLEFSRIGRKAMELQELDMHALATAAYEQAVAFEPDREIVAEIEVLPVAYGEPAMLRQVWENLLMNAVKFTRPREAALIQIGATRERGETIYFVRDNGAGFDMAYAGKLFGVFQRLHREDQFEGTGVGLAIVKRIIKRHGGRVWAEGVIDQGATFFFALPDHAQSEVSP